MSSALVFLDRSRTLSTPLSTPGRPPGSGEGSQSVPIRTPERSARNSIPWYNWGPRFSPWWSRLSPIRRTSWPYRSTTPSNRRSVSSFSTAQMTSESSRASRDEPGVLSRHGSRTVEGSGRCSRVPWKLTFIHRESCTRRISIGPIEKIDRMNYLDRAAAFLHFASDLENAADVPRGHNLRPGGLDIVQLAPA